ncbi:Glyoxylase, beta-lactamase superfamily II [Saccharopolyspora kobensis]|uniref:Glyoxylase, beta-lactamase superfamily II n=1 Tax=Saccharopolyspora kobensis TaxID=146035 RepID=A0A1H6CDG7_9PSEU|nr:MBL fold metallo-hydrolase [Saccharopolyspora kobensis]SEG70902.1 Glyoxylase, beta-lactamase superfamily II [Saccharopolyspora kobensis]SFC36238.1 Glyoxylase, beta-lactamase superfamily II [Saccharopolyspora kobensis]
MLVLGFPVGPLQANCYVLARGEGEPCVVVDPGQDAAEPLRTQLTERRLTPAAVLLTHGHFDHVFSAGEICAEHGVPAHIHPADRHMLTDPGSALGPAGRQLFGDGLVMDAPTDVREIAGGDVLELAGLSFEVTHTPGHTGGSVLFGVRTEEGGQLLLSGDTLFAGAIGRTDLPGGDHGRMLESLSTQVLPLDDDVVVLPGHGPTTTIGRERAGNPFLQGLPASDAIS